MNRRNLEKNNICYFEHLDESVLPQHVVTLRRALVDFRCTITERLGFYEEGDFEDRRALKERLDDLAPVEKDHIKSSIAKHQHTQFRARGCHEGRDREAEWKSFFMDRFLGPLSEQMAIKEEDSRRVSRAKYYYDSFEYAEDRPWPLFTESFRREYGQTGLSAPKPDKVAYFPIYDLSRADDRIVNFSTRWYWNERAVDGIIQNFSCSVLQNLADCGLQPSPAAIFREGRNKRIMPSDCICYPWMIVEHKKYEYRKAEECYCQAANATTGALMMLRILSRYRNADEVIPPVVAITTIGRDVGVWIAYVDDNYDQYRMTRIWEGQVTNITDIVKLEVILENLHTWAMRVLRPWISHYIDQWRSKNQINLPQVPGINDELSPSMEIMAKQLNSLVLAPRSTKSQDEEESLGDSLKISIQTELEELVEKIDTLVQKNTERILVSISNSGTQFQTRSISTQTEPYFDICEPLIPSNHLISTESSTVPLSSQPGESHSQIGSSLSDIPQTEKLEGLVPFTSTPVAPHRKILPLLKKSRTNLLGSSTASTTPNLPPQFFVFGSSSPPTTTNLPPQPFIFGSSSPPTTPNLSPGTGLFDGSAPSTTPTLPLGTGSFSRSTASSTPVQPISSISSLTTNSSDTRPVALFRNGSKNDVVRFLKKQNESFHITDNILQAAAGNMRHGRDVMDILLKERGDEVQITEGVLRAAMKNAFGRQNVIELLLDQRWDEVQITADLMRVAISTLARSELIAQLLDRWGAETQISQDMLELVLYTAGNGSETLRLLLQRSRTNLKITDDVVLAAVKNQIYSTSMIRTLLLERGDEVNITQDVVQAAAANECSGAELMEFLLERCGGNFKITEKVLEAVAGNRLCGPRIILLLLEQRPDEVQVTPNVVSAAHLNGSSGADILALLTQSK